MRGTVGVFAPIREYVEALVHPSAQQDALTASRHRAFIAPRLLGSIVARRKLGCLGWSLGEQYGCAADQRKCNQNEEGACHFVLLHFT